MPPANVLHPLHPGLDSRKAPDTRAPRPGPPHGPRVLLSPPCGEVTLLRGQEPLSAGEYCRPPNFPKTRATSFSCYPSFCQLRRYKN